MKIPRALLSIFAFGSSAFGFAAAQASAQTVITALPYTITAAGHYTINGNLTSTSTTAAAITINAPNVILDLNGYFVAGPGNPAASTVSNNSVISVGDVANVTIKNGTLAGDIYGIYFTSTTAANARNYIVDSVTITRCYYMGVLFLGAAPGSVIRNCSISNLGNSTNISDVYGLNTDGGVRIENNNIGGLTAGNGGMSIGIYGNNGDFEIGNTIVGCTIGIDFGTYLNNLTYGCTTPFADGTNATGNN